MSARYPRFRDVPVGHIFRYPDCDECFFRKTGEWSFEFAVRCEWHQRRRSTLDTPNPVMAFPVVYDPFIAELEAMQ
jgi:hypothetical protein